MEVSVLVAWALAAPHRSMPREGTGQAQQGLNDLAVSDGAPEGRSLIFPRSGGHLSKLGMIRAEVMDGEYSTGIHG